MVTSSDAPATGISAAKSILSSVSNWDPLGIALEEPPPPSNHARRLPGSRAPSLSEPFPSPMDLVDGPPRPTARAELTQLTKAVVEFVEAAQDLPFARGSDPASLGACLQQCLQEWRDDADAAQRELQSLRQTVALLQADRRSSSLAAASAPAPAAAAAAAQEAAQLREEVARLRKQLQEAASAAANGLHAPPLVNGAAPAEAAAAAARSACDELRAERQAREAVHQAELEAAYAQIATLRAAGASAAATAATERTAAVAAALEQGRLEERGAAAAVARREKVVLAAARAAEACVWRGVMAEAEAETRTAGEGLRQEMAATRQKAAKMLARKDADLSGLRRANQLLAKEKEARGRATAGGGGSGSGSGDGAAATAKSLTHDVAVGTADDGSGVGGEAHGGMLGQTLPTEAELLGSNSRLLQKAAAWPDEATRVAATALAAVQSPAPPPPGGFGFGAGASADAGGSGSAAFSPEGGQALAVRFARRVSQLEASLAQAHERVAVVEAARDQAEGQVRQARARLKQQQRSLERIRGTSPDLRDEEYSHNILYRYLTLTSEAEKAQLLPVLAAVFAFSQAELNAVAHARSATASAGGWVSSLWGGGASPAAGLVPPSPAVPVTPLATPAGAAARRPPRAPPSSARVVAAPGGGATAGAVGADEASTGAPEVAALQAKVHKLRGLLHCANQEIGRLSAQRP